MGIATEQKSDLQSLLSSGVGQLQSPAPAELEYLPSGLPHADPWALVTTATAARDKSVHKELRLALVTTGEELNLRRICAREKSP